MFNMVSTSSYSRIYTDYKNQMYGNISHLGKIPKKAAFSENMKHAWGLKQIVLVAACKKAAVMHLLLLVSQTPGSALGLKQIQFGCLCSSWSKSWHCVSVKTSSKWRLWEPRGSCWDVDTCNGAQTSTKSFTTNTCMYAKCINMHQNRAKIIKPEQTWMLHKCFKFDAKMCQYREAEMTNPPLISPIRMVPNRAAAGILVNKPWF